MYLGIKIGEHEFKCDGGSEDHCRQMYREWRRSLSAEFGILTDQELEVRRFLERLGMPSPSRTTGAPVNRGPEGERIELAPVAAARDRLEAQRENSGAGEAGGVHVIP